MIIAKVTIVFEEDDAETAEYDALRIIDRAKEISKVSKSFYEVENEI